MQTLRLTLLWLLPLAGLAQPTEAVPGWTSSASEAYLISAASTAGAIGVGYVLYRVFPAPDPDSDEFAPRHAALSLVALGVFAGPSMGNMALGAVRDTQRGLAIKAIGLGAGTALALGSALVIVGCFGGSECAGSVERLLTAGAVVAGTGLVAGTVYDLATIPGNAARARERGVAPRPVLGLRGGRPTLGLRLDL